MFRRDFLKAAIVAGSPVPIPQKLITEVLPFRPTVAWLNKDSTCVRSASFTCHAQDSSWDGFVVYESQYRWIYKRVNLVFRKGKWMVVGSHIVSREGLWGYDEELEWPDWLRKF